MEDIIRQASKYLEAILRIWYLDDVRWGSNHESRLFRHSQ